MSDEINYLDLLVLRKVDAESTVEKFGSHINTSFFETANLLGTMKIKGLLDIQSSIGGQSPIIVTGDGRDLLAEAVKKSSEPLDTLDQAILHALAGGASDLAALQVAINIRSRDLAFHLHKLKTADLIDYEVRSGKVRLLLTEKGFNQTGGVRSSVAPGAAPKTGSASASAAAGIAPTSTSGIGLSAPAPGAKPVKPTIFQGASAPISLDSEINDLLNFAGWNKPKPTPGANLSAPGRGAPLPMPTAIPRATPASSSTSPANPATVSSKPATAPVSAPVMGTRPVPLPQDSPPASPPGPAKLDRTAMLFSKLEYYARQYLFYAVLLILVLVVIGYALSSIAPHAGA